MIGRLRSWDSCAVLFLAGWHFIYYLPVSLGQRVFSDGDIFLFFIPIHTELARALGEGRLPLWTPYIQGGYPLLAEGQVEALYPLNLLLHLLFPVPNALSYLILIDMSLISVGMYLLSRAYGLRIAGAALAGFVVGASGFEIAHLPHIPHLATAALLPWLLWALQKYFNAKLDDRSRAIWFFILVILVALNFLAGFPQFAFFNVATLALAVVAQPFFDQLGPTDSSRARWMNDLRQAPANVRLALSVILLGTGIAAVQLLPTAELVSLSIRAQEVGKGFFTSYSLEPQHLIELLLPFSQLQRPDAGNMEYWGYLGIIPLALALGAPFLRRDARTWFFFLFGLIALSLALGGSNPLYEWLYYLPVVNRFRVPARYLFLFTFAFAYLAGVGFQNIQERLKHPTELRHLVEWTGGIAIGILALTGIWLSYALPSQAWVEAWSVLPLLFGAVAITIFVLAKMMRINQTAFGVLVIGFSVLDLTLFAAPFNGTIARIDLASDLTTAPRTVQAMDTEQPIYRVLANKVPALMRASMRAGLLWNFPLQFGKEGVAAYLPSLALKRNQEYVDRMTPRMRDLMNMRYYLLPLQNEPWADPLDLDNEPSGGLSFAAISKNLFIPPTSAAKIQIVSYTDQTTDLPDGYPVGEIVLKSSDGIEIRLSIRLGIETADWAHEGISKAKLVKHKQPKNSMAFPAFLAVLGDDFTGRKYVAEYDLGQSLPFNIVQLSAKSFLPNGMLNIESMNFLDEAGKKKSLAKLLDLNELELGYRSHNSAVWENGDVLPRAFIVYKADVVPDDQALSRLMSAEFDPRQVILLNDAPPLQSARNTMAIGRVLIAEYKSDRVVVEATTDQAGYLILADTWYPGWIASVDGQRVPIYRADYIFRAITLEPGTHRVEFKFHSESFASGLAVSLFCLVSLGALTLFGQRWI